MHLLNTEFGAQLASSSGQLFWGWSLLLTTNIAVDTLPASSTGLMPMPFIWCWSYLQWQQIQHQIKGALSTTFCCNISIQHYKIVARSCALHYLCIIKEQPTPTLSHWICKNLTGASGLGWRGFVDTGPCLTSGIRELKLNWKMLEHHIICMLLI